MPAAGYLVPQYRIPLARWEIILSKIPGGVRLRRSSRNVKFATQEVGEWQPCTADSRWRRVAYAEQ